MPIYRYECDICGWVDEFLQGVSAPTTYLCPSCGNVAHRLMPTEVTLTMGTSGRRVDAADLANKAYMERPEFKARVDKGEIEIKMPKNGTPKEAMPNWMK